jgi:molecular chaperone DnaK
MGLGKTLTAAQGSGLDFGSAIDSLPAPSVKELDELSVAALLPDDEDDVAEFDLSHPGLDSLKPRRDAGLPAAASSLPQPISTIEDSVANALSQRPLAHAPAPAAIPLVARRAPLLLDVTPLSLGVEVIGGYVDTLIERNSPIPCENTRTFATARDNQAMVRVRVSQGEEQRFDRNTLLGEVELTGLSQGPRGSVKVDVSFSLDESGMLQVSAKDTATGRAADARLMLVGVAPTNR